MRIMGSDLDARQQTLAMPRCLTSPPYRDTVRRRLLFLPQVPQIQSALSSKLGGLHP